MALTLGMQKFGRGAVLALMAGCAMDPNAVTPEEDPNAPVTDPDEIVGTNSVARNGTIASYVLLPLNATDSQIVDAVKRQVRPLLGAMHAIQVGTNDRDARNVDPSTFQRDTVTIVDPANPMAPTTQMLRVRYTYTDRMAVNRSVIYSGRSVRSTIETTLLASDWANSGTMLTDSCTSEHADWGAGYLYFLFDPTTSRCRQMIQAEDQTILRERRGLSSDQITVHERDRVFLPATVRLRTISDTRTRYPEYDRLFARDTFTAYSFFGADEVTSARDVGAENFMVFLRTLSTAFPQLTLTAADGSDLTRVTYNGRTITGVTPQRVWGWIIDDANYPSEISWSDRDNFRKAVIAQWRDRFIDLSMSMNVAVTNRTTHATQSHPLAVTFHVYYADRPSTSLYERAWADGDVVQYTGHTYIGSGGPIDARNYTSSDFPDRYQIFMTNSCVSFSYYNNQFFDLHPGGTRNLDTISNGLSVWLKGSGLSSARLFTGLLNGRSDSWSSLLSGMVIDLSWAPRYDANRVVDGETDNVFSPTRTTVALTRGM